MSELEKLLEGVRVNWKTLGDVVAIANTGVDKKSNTNEKEVRLLNFVDVFKNQYISKETPTMVVTASEKKINDCNIKRGDLFITPSSELIDEIGFSAMAIEDFKDAVYSYHIMRLRIVDTDFLFPAFLNYLFSSSAVRKQIKLKAQGITRFGLTQPKWKSIQIPIPPLQIQKEIVRFLDRFTELTAELTAELEAEFSARKQQYNYYREELLGFEEGDVEYKSLGEVAEYSKTRISFDKLDETNYVGVDNLLQNREGKTISIRVPIKGNSTKFMIHDILIGNIRPYLKKIWYSDRVGGTNGDVLVLHPIDNNIVPRFLYQILADDNFFKYNMKHAKGAKMPRGDKAKIMDYKIPIPTIEEQKRIISILDKFDTLTNSIREGLLKEIELRKKQYEYYRERLLTFPQQKSA